MITGVTGQDGAYLSELLLKKGAEVHDIKRWDEFIGQAAQKNELLENFHQFNRLKHSTSNPR